MSQITLQYQPTELRTPHFFKCVTLIIKSYKYFYSHNNDEWVLFNNTVIYGDYTGFNKIFWGRQPCHGVKILHFKLYSSEENYQHLKNSQ